MEIKISVLGCQYAAKPLRKLIENKPLWKGLWLHLSINKTMTFIECLKFKTIFILIN